MLQHSRLFICALGAAALAGWLGAGAAAFGQPVAWEAAPATASGKDMPGSPVPPTAGTKTTAPKPYSAVRWDEDYSYLKDPAARTDYTDPLKYIRLGADDVYLSVGGQVRERYEFFNNYLFSPPATSAAGPQDDDGYFLTRLLVHADLHATQYFRLFVQGKSAMEDGRDGGPRATDADEVDVQQAFADGIIPLGGKNSVTVRFGRQDLIYGAQRLISPLDWTNNRRTFEGLKVSSQVGVCTTDVFWVRPVNVEKEELNDGDGQTSFAGVYNSTALSDFMKGSNTKLDVYFLALNRTNARFATNSATTSAAADEDRYTLGVRMSGNPKPFDYDVELDYQFGQFGNADISAWAAAAEMGYTVGNCPATPRLILGFDYASGDGNPNSGDLHTFNQLFPLGHAYFGFIDVIGRQNIMDLHPGVELTFVQDKSWAKKLGLRADYHLFWRASTDDAVYNAGSGAGSSPSVSGVLRADGGSDKRFVGSEIDLLLTWQFDRHVQVLLGYSHFFAGGFIKETGKATGANRDIDFIYLQMQYTF